MTDSLGENLVWSQPAFHLVQSFSPHPHPKQASGTAYLQRVNGLCTRGKCQRRGGLAVAGLCVWFRQLCPGTKGLKRKL